MNTVPVFNISQLIMNQTFLWILNLIWANNLGSIIRGFIRCVGLQSHITFRAEFYYAIILSYHGMIAVQPAI